MPTPDILAAARAFRSALVAGETRQRREMAQRWLAVEAALIDKVELLVREAQAGGWTPWQVSQAERYRTLLEQVGAQLSNYVGHVRDTTSERQAALARLGVHHAEQLVSLLGGPGVQGQFARLPVPAVEALAGMASDGSPLHTVLVDAAAAGVDGLRTELISGLALGRNPRETARIAMRRGLGRSYTRMETIARTETLRAYREATLQSYRQSRVVTGYRRLSARDRRTCAACWALDGKYYALEEEFEEHPCGRCLMLPVLYDGRQAQIEPAAARFAGLSDADKLHVLGPERMRLYQGGMALERFGATSYSSRWGGSVRLRPLAELAPGP